MKIIVAVLFFSVIGLSGCDPVVPSGNDAIALAIGLLLALLIGFFIFPPRKF